MSSDRWKAGEGWMVRAMRALENLPCPVGGNLSYIAGVLASHPNTQAREIAFERLYIAAHYVDRHLVAREIDEACDICDAEREAEA